MNKADELVAVFDAKLVKEFHGKSGEILGLSDLLRLGSLEQACKFKKRGEVETNESFRQLIPYVILHNEDRKVFAYQRSKSGGEDRLHDLWSVGIGGHINQEDDTFGRNCLLEIAALRELDEEVRITGHFDEDWLRTRSFICLDKSPVDRVHFGVVFSLYVEGPVEPKNGEIGAYKWCTVEELSELNLEDWSKECLGLVPRFFESR